MKLVFEIPMVFANYRRSAKRIFIDHGRLPYYLNLKSVDLNLLREAGRIVPDIPPKIPKPRINYTLLAQEYRQKLEIGEFSTHAELAKNPGVGRAWISKVLNPPVLLPISGPR